MPPKTAVLDTNTLLDWLVFRDPATAALSACIAAGGLVWRATPAMRLEFDRVLPGEAFVRWHPDATAAETTWRRLAHLEEAEPPAGPLRCTDPDDQVFIDLALYRRCTWLLTRDRALLRLAPRAAAWGVTVLTPHAWSQHEAAAHGPHLAAACGQHSRRP